MENEPMKCSYDFEEPTSKYYLQLRNLYEYVKDLKDAVDTMANGVKDMLVEYQKLEEKKESDLAVQKAYEMFVKKDAEPVLDNSLDQECPVDEKIFGKEKSVDDFSILNLIPEQAKKWVGRLTVDEMIKAVNDADKLEGYKSEDEYIGELVDNLKDMAIAKYTNDILAGRITTIEDEEIRSEVVDYMERKGLDIPEGIKPKKSALDKLYNTFKSFKTTNEVTDNIEELIKKLDAGETLELQNDMLTKVIDRLWDTRDNVSIRVNNNKIKLG